jgi:hypothetical protein
MVALKGKKKIATNNYMWLMNLGRAWRNSSWILRYDKKKQKKKKKKCCQKPKWEVTKIGNNLTFTSLGLGQIMGISCK